MKITCTKEEKENIQTLVQNSPLCIIGEKRIEFCGYYPSCTKCLEKEIEWEVTDDGCGKG